MTEVARHPPSRPADFIDSCSHRASGTGSRLRTEGVVVTVSGMLDHATAAKFRMRVMQLLTVPHESFTLDLHGLEFIDGAGVAALTVARREAHARGIAFTLTAVPSHVREELDRAESTTHS
jgi:anti-anti-sigma factor